MIETSKIFFNYMSWSLPSPFTHSFNFHIVICISKMRSVMFRKNKNCQLVMEKQDLNLLWLSHSIVNIVTNITIWQVVLAGETASFWVVKKEEEEAWNWLGKSKFPSKICVSPTITITIYLLVIFFSPIRKIESWGQTTKTVFFYSK